MTDNTMSLTMHLRPGTRVAIAVDETTKRIGIDLRHHPNPEKAVAIPEPLAGPLVNLALHRTDLRRAREFLDEFENQGGVQPEEAQVYSGFRMSTACRALWLAALASTMKCFQHSESRTEKLDLDTIFGADATQPVRATFDLLKKLRNKHVLYDENDWMQATPLAIVGAQGYQPVVSDIDCMVIEGTDTAHIGQLGMVVNAALTWVNQEMDKQPARRRKRLDHPKERQRRDRMATAGALGSRTTPNQPLSPPRAIPPRRRRTRLTHGQQRQTCPNLPAPRARSRRARCVPTCPTGRANPPAATTHPRGTPWGRWAMPSV